MKAIRFTNNTKISDEEKPGLASKTGATSLFVVLLAFVILDFGSVNLIYLNQAQQAESERPSGGCTLPHSYATQGKLGAEDYTVQINSFDSEKEAYWESARLRGMRINNFIYQNPKGGKWLVCVGRYWTEARAERFKVDLNRRFGLKAVVLKPSDRVLPPPKPKPPKGGCQ